MIQAVIFDMDGTLTDTEALWMECACAYLEHLGITPSPEDRALIGRYASLEQLLILRQRGRLPQDVNIPAALEWMRQRMAAFYRRGVPLKDGTADWLTALRERGLPCMLFTATPQPLAEEVFAHHRLLHCFTLVRSSAEFPPGTKKEPAAFLACARLLGVSPQGCLVVEDSWGPAAAAHQAGCQVWGVLDPAHSADCLDALRQWSHRFFNTTRAACDAFLAEET